jgi:hypothetical protein
MVKSKKSGNIKTKNNAQNNVQANNVVPELDVASQKKLDDIKKI